jgi:aspartyl-tRNA synthetase
MSFIKETDIYNTIEPLLARIWSKVLNIEIKTPFIHMDFQEAMERLEISCDFT